MVFLPSPFLGRCLPLMLLLALLAAAAPARAELSKQLGNLEVHYNAIVTADLAPEVARAYGIDRSRSRGLVTVAVLRKNHLGVGQPVSAEIKVTAVNLTAQLLTVPMREIREGAAIYYIGEFRLGPQEDLRFTVGVKAEGETGAGSFEFRKRFY